MTAAAAAAAAGRPYRIGVDVGGTFTDVVVADDAGGAVLAKASTTPRDQSEGVLEGLRLAAERLGLPLADLLARAERIVHGTTVATNALLERRAGARVAMLTTEGHRDVVEMREGLKPDRYDLRAPPPPPLVPRDLRLPVRERLRPDGRVETPLDEASLAAALDAARSAGTEAVAVCFLHAWRDPSHERRAGEAARAALPDAHVTLSSEVLPRIGEYDRFATAAANAYVGPLVSRYLARLAARLAGAGYAGPVLVILSHGGVAPLAEAGRLAAATALSGPAGGVAAARALAGAGLDAGLLVTFDMGGTSTDAALVRDGIAPVARGGREVGGERLALPSLDIATVGAGGGSVARAGPDGLLRVGPESAGADPGPACYGRGGREATVTDANLVLGLLDHECFLGGARRLDADAARAALARLGASLGVSALEAAEGVHRLVNLRMADGIRLVTVRRGVDPRRGGALLAYGGAAGLHAVGVARELGMGRVLVPLLAAGLSAWGMLATDLRHEEARTALDAGGDDPLADDARLAALFAALETDARARLACWAEGAADGGPAISVERSADLRYGEQVFEVDVPLPSDPGWWSAPGLGARMRAAFHARHEALFTYALPGDPVVLVNARVAASAASPPVGPPRPTARAVGGAPARSRHRRVWLGRSGGWRDVPAPALSDLAPGDALLGPAAVEAEATTVLLGPGDEARLDARGWLDVRVSA